MNRIEAKEAADARKLKDEYNIIQDLISKTSALGNYILVWNDYPSDVTLKKLAAEKFTVNPIKDSEGFTKGIRIYWD